MVDEDDLLEIKELIKKVCDGVKNGRITIDRAKKTLARLNRECPPQSKQKISNKPERPSGRIVNFDMEPNTPRGWLIRLEDQITSRISGKKVFNQEEIKTYLSDEQKRGLVSGDNLMKDLCNKPVAGAELLDFYLANPHQIPEEWNGKNIFFWGTVFYNSGDLYVKYLFVDKGKWDWASFWLEKKWGGNDPALLIVSEETPSQVKPERR